MIAQAIAGRENSIRRIGSLLEIIALHEKAQEQRGAMCPDSGEHSNPYSSCDLLNSPMAMSHPAEDGRIPPSGASPRFFASQTGAQLSSA